MGSRLPAVRSTSPGFTLVELMIVVAIIGILAAIAIPSYSIFVARAQFSEGLSLAGSVKTAVGEEYGSRNRLSGIDNGVGAIPARGALKGSYVADVVVEDGIITARFDADSALAGASMTLIPTERDGSIIWKCTTTASALKAPSNCRDKTPDNLGSVTVPTTR